MDDREFRDAVKQILGQARQRSLEETARLLELGDAYGDVDLGGWQDLMKVTGSPGTVARTALGSIANVANKARTLVTTVLKGMPSLVVPFIRTRYEKIFTAEKQRQREIERMYPEIFAIARRGFPDDGRLFAFMLEPIIMTATNVTSLGADLALDLTDALSGNSPDVITRTRPLRRRVGGGVAGEALSLRNSLLLEAEPQPQGGPQRRPKATVKAADPKADVDGKPDGSTPGAELGIERDIEALLSDPSLRQTLSQAQPVIDIRQRARDLKNDSLHSVINDATKIMEAESIEDLANLGLDLEIDMTQFKAGLENAESLEAVEQIVHRAQQEMMKALTTRLQHDVEKIQTFDLPTETELLKVYQKTLQRVQNLLQSKEPPTQSATTTSTTQVSAQSSPTQSTSINNT